MTPIEDKQKLYNGFGESFSRAIEFVVTPVLFGLLGHLVDGWLGTGVLVMLVLGGFGLVGMFLRTWYAYDEAMRVEERNAPWSRT